MCARLLACPLCSHPSFSSLDALRAGLVNVATRPLACPVCDEMLLGIDKLTIHLFGHTIDQAASGGEAPKAPEAPSTSTSTTVQAIPIQSWSVVSDAAEKSRMDGTTEGSGTGIYIPIDEIETYRNLTAIKDVNGMPVPNGQKASTEMKAPSQVIFVQNVGTQPKIFSANLVEQSTEQQEPMATNAVQDTPSTSTSNSNVDVVASNSTFNHESEKPSTQVESNSASNSEGATKQREKIVISVDITDDEVTQPNWSNNANSEGSPITFEPSHTDRLADLVKNAQITASPLGTFHEAYDCSKPPSPTASASASTSASNTQNKPSTTASAVNRTERCNICGLSFPDRNILILHKQLVHMIQEKDSNVSPDDLMKNYPCHLCTKVFKMRGSLMVHMRVAHPGFNTTVHFAADRSQNTQNEEKAESPGPGYNCPVCGKTFKREQHVTQHLKIHDGKQWACDICGKMFTTKYFLKKHKRLHSGEMPYKCNLCDKTFTFQQSFHKHRFYHKDDKPHSCTTCGRSFKELSTLHNHERIHTGEKPFACESCGKCFRQRVSYLVHRRIHTGVMPYTCSTCGKTFRYKVSQRNHKCPRQAEVDTQNQESQDQQMMETSAEKEIRQPVQAQNLEQSQVASEENQYVLVMNNEGQHVLKKQSEVQNNQSNNTTISEQNSVDSGESSDFIKNIWNEQMNNQMEYKETNSKINETISAALESSGMWNGVSKNQNSLLSSDGISKQFSTEQVNGEFPKDLWDTTLTNQATYQKVPNKNQSDNANDFFSLVASPLENGISSPSSEMEHLTLSSPVNNRENSSEAIDGFVPMNGSNNVVQVTNVANESFNDNNDNFSTLQSINEDSLKELLYSIVDK